MSPLGGRDARDIESTVTEFASRGPNGGLIAAASPLSINTPGLIISLAARHRLPATYPYRFFVADGGLVSYGPDSLNRTGKLLTTSIVSLRARNPPICRYKRRLSTSW